MTTPVLPWTHQMAECLSELEREQIGSACPVVDHEVRPGTESPPDDLRVWLICRTKRERREFADTERARTVSMLKRKMLDRGFPESAIDSLVVNVTSREEIQAGGGFVS